jgi:hypothetical protein
MSVAVKYDLGPVMVEAMTDPAAAIEKLHALALKLQGEVAAIDAANVQTGDKVNALEERYGKDDAGKASAETFLRMAGGVFELITDYIGDDPGRTFHVKNAVQDLLGKYLSNECSFFVNAITPKAAKTSRKGEFKADFNEVRDLMVHVVGMARAAGYDPSTSKVLTTTDDGKTYRSVLPGYRGTKSSDDGTVTGRYAKVYNLAWTIDDEPLEPGWTIPEIVRLLWTGADRIGKNAKSLTDVLDTETGWDKTDWQHSDFEVNGHTVSVNRTTDED